MIEMRHQLGMTQTDLARALEVALPTVGRWESWDPPKGLILGLLARFAESANLAAAAVFRQALGNERIEVLSAQAIRSQIDKAVAAERERCANIAENNDDWSIIAQLIRCP